MFMQKQEFQFSLKKQITRKILAFCDTEYRGCLKVPIDRRLNCPKVLQYKSNLNRTMLFYVCNAENIMVCSTKGKAKEAVESILEEVKFLQNMKTSRTMIFGRKDKKLYKLENKRNLVKRKNELRIEKQMHRNTENSMDELLDHVISNSNIEEEQDDDQDDDEKMDNFSSVPSTSSSGQRKHKKI